MIPTPKSGSQAVITQEDLVRYQMLQGQVRALTRQLNQERRRLVDLVESHAPVEPGRFQIMVKESTQQSTTKAALVNLLGVEEYEVLRSEVAPTVFRRLVVRVQPGPWGPNWEGAGHVHW